MDTTDVVCDTSVVLKWFHEEGETGVAEARALLEAHRAERLRAWVIDLTFYELGNVLLRARGWSATDVAARLDDLRAICAVAPLGATELRIAARLGEAHSLTFYDALYAAAAQTRDAALATDDGELLACGAGERPEAIVARVTV